MREGLTVPADEHARFAYPRLHAGCKDCGFDARLGIHSEDKGFTGSPGAGIDLGRAKSYLLLPRGVVVWAFTGRLGASWLI